MKESEGIVAVNLDKIGTREVRELRSALKQNGNAMMVIKKRLIDILLKGKDVSYNLREFKAPVGTVFAKNLETATKSVWEFTAKLQKEKKIEKPNILGGYDLARNQVLDAERVMFIGKLPPREAILGQFLGLLASPIRQMLYILSEKSKRS